MIGYISVNVTEICGIYSLPVFEKSPILKYTQEDAQSDVECGSARQAVRVSVTN